jgi:hypothetical protein
VEGEDCRAEIEGIPAHRIPATASSNAHARRSPLSRGGRDVLDRTGSYRDALLGGELHQLTEMFPRMLSTLI